MTDDPRAAAFEQAMIDVLAEMTHRAGDGCTGPQDGVCLSPDTDLRQEDWCDRCLMGFILKAVDDGLLKAEPPAEGPTWQPTRELLIRADSYLSLLWHRFVPGNKKDADLTFNVERTIGDLRAAYTPPRDPAGKE